MHLSLRVNPLNPGAAHSAPRGRDIFGHRCSCVARAEEVLQPGGLFAADVQVERG